MELAELKSLSILAARSGPQHVPRRPKAGSGLTSGMEELVQATVHKNTCNLILLVCVIMAYDTLTTEVGWEVYPETASCCGALIV
jgi:hypothetical protein